MKIFDFMIKVNVRLNIQVEREDNSTEATNEFDTIPEEIMNEVELLYSPVPAVYQPAQNEERQET